MSVSPAARSRARRAVKRGVALVISLGYLAVTRIVSLFAGKQRTPPIVLTYHSILSDDVAAFEWQVRYLSRTARLAFVDDALHHEKDSVAVTFDDALSNVFEHALPTLARYRVPATLFVPTGYLGASPGWIDPSRNPQQVAGLVASAEMLRSLDQRLVRLGSHSVTHAKLDAVPRERCQTELATSKRDLEALTGVPVRLLSLPYGRWSESVLNDAREAGYRWVLANVPMSSQRHLAIPLVGRVDVSPRDSKLEFRLKVAGAYGWMAVAVPAKRAALSFLKPVLQR